MNGRNFLDLALLVPGVSPDERRQHAAVSGNVSGSRRQPLGRQPAQSVEQLHRRRAVRQRRCRRLERHHLRRRCRRAVSGRDLGCAGGARARPGRLRQRRHQERHQRPARHGLRLLPRRSLQRRRTRCRERSCRWTRRSTAAASADRSSRNRTFYFTNVEQRRLDQTGLATISDANVAAVNARLAAVGYQGPLIATGIYPNPVDSTNLLAKVDHQVNGRDQFSVRYSLYDVAAENSRGAGGLNAPSASAALDNLRPDDRDEQHA